MYDIEIVLHEIPLHHQSHFWHCCNQLFKYGREELPLNGLGDFLQAIVKGDLFDAVGRADSINIRYLRQYVVICYNEMPSDKINLNTKELKKLRKGE